MSYGANLDDLFRRIGTRGQDTQKGDVADLPVERPAEFELVQRHYASRIVTAEFERAFHGVRVN